MSDSLPGLEKLLAVLRDHGDAAELRPPSANSPCRGDTLLGDPVDPLLVVFYSRCDGGRLGDLHIGPYTALASFNERMRAGAEPRLQKLLCYGGIAGLAEYFATVPSLAGPDGAQPVVYLQSYMDKTILPFASNLDRAFELYARYCHEQISLCGSLWDEPPIDRSSILFPDSFAKRVAQDEPLVRLLADGRFDNLIVPDESSRDWVQSVLVHRQSL